MICVASFGDFSFFICFLPCKISIHTYFIGLGGMFELVSGANFLGEIIEWTGFAIAVSLASTPPLCPFCNQLIVC